jgi:HicB family
LESLHRQLADLAKSEGISINQLIATAAAEKLAALTTEEYLKARAKRASQRNSRLRVQRCRKRRLSQAMNFRRDISEES